MLAVVLIPEGPGLDLQVPGLASMQGGVERSVSFSSRPRGVVAITMYVTTVRPCLILHLSSPINQTLGEGVPSGPSSEKAEQGKQ